MDCGSGSTVPGWTQATNYTSGPGFVRLSYPVTDGVRPTLTEFSPDGSPVVLFGLTLSRWVAVPVDVNRLRRRTAR